MRNTNTAAIGALVWVVAVAGLSAWLLSPYWVNLPWIDDYQTIVDFLIHSRTDSLPHFLGRTLWQPHNEHRIVLSRLLMWVVATVRQDAAFDVLPVVATLSKGVLAGLVWRLWQRERLPWLAFPVVPLLLFAPRDMQNMIWSTAALANLPVVAFAALSFYAFDRSRYGWSALLAGLALLTTGGSGLVVLPVLCLGVGHRFGWVRAGLGLVGVGVVYVLYKQGLNQAPIDLTRPGPVLLKALAFPGAMVRIDPVNPEYSIPYTWPTVLTGLLITGITARRLLDWLQNTDSFFAPALLLYCLLAGGLVALFRPGVLESRFTTYSLLAVTLSYQYVVRVLRQPQTRLAFLSDTAKNVLFVSLIAGSGWYFYACFGAYRPVAQLHRRGAIAEFNTVYYSNSPLREPTRQKLRRLEQAGFFSPARHRDYLLPLQSFSAPLPPGTSSPVTLTAATIPGVWTVAAPTAFEFIVLRKLDAPVGQLIILPAVQADARLSTAASTAILANVWLDNGQYALYLLQNQQLIPTPHRLAGTRTEVFFNPDEHY